MTRPVPKKPRKLRPPSKAWCERMARIELKVGIPAAGAEALRHSRLK